MTSTEDKLQAKNHGNTTAALPPISFALYRLLHIISWLASAALALRFLETSTCFKLCTPSIFQPLNVHRLLVNALCASQCTALACARYVFDTLAMSGGRPARTWRVPLLPSRPARACTIFWLGAVPCLKLRGAGGVCAGLPCSRRP